MTFPLKDLLQIREIAFGEFPEIADLNPRFKPDSKKVKATLDIQLPPGFAGVDLSSILQQLMELLPTLKRHQCGESLFSNLKGGEKDSSPAPDPTLCLNHPDKITDLAHLMEHMIIDLQSNITNMDSCSGITCGYKNPPNRFDMFVECKDQTVGLFSVLFAADLFARFLEKGKITRRYRHLIDLAKYLFRNPAKRNSADLAALTDHVATEMGLRKNYAGALIQRLKDFGFLNNHQI
jgi:hypothetical protein